MPRKTDNQASPNANNTRDKLERPDHAQQKNPVRIFSSWLHDPVTQAVFKALNTNGFTTRVVGGAVRNALMGLPSTDIDFATTALPDEVTQLCSNAGIAFTPRASPTVR